MKSQSPMTQYKMWSDEKPIKTNTKSKFNYYDYITMKISKWYTYDWTLAISWDIYVHFSQRNDMILKDQVICKI